MAGTDAKSILEKARLMLARNTKWDNPFGDGKAGFKIVEILRRQREELENRWPGDSRASFASTQ